MFKFSSRRDLARGPFEITVPDGMLEAPEMTAGAPPNAGRIVDIWKYGLA